MKIRLFRNYCLPVLLLTGLLCPAAEPEEFKVGIIGLDTSHAIAFTKILNDPEAPPELAGCRVVAAYPKGSYNIESSVSRIPKYTEQIKGYGVEIVNSIDSLLQKVDVVLLESNDGRPHLEQARPVIAAGKPLFIDKPMTASVADAMQIFTEAEQAGVPVFSSSSLRFGNNTKEVVAGKIGKVHYCETHSPASIEKTHPDLFWYGIHGVESLFTVMGTGCQKVERSTTEDGKIQVTGTWEGNRTGVFREGKGFGGLAKGEKGEAPVGSYDTYRPLLVEIVKFFRTGIPPVNPKETLEILAFMEAADVSKRRGGEEVLISEIMDAAKQKLNTRVTVHQLNDRFRFDIDGRLFTEWRHDEWKAPYLYPVMGPNGVGITRNFPMQSGHPHESQDHPHHRSLRFAHSNINGLNFWYWRPGKEDESPASIRLNRVEKMQSGDTGELVVWNDWLNGEKVILREKLRLVVTPLADRQSLIDYDIELHAVEEPVTFHDAKDGGMLVRVAGTMKAQQHRKEGDDMLDGTILNSEGHKNAAAWGKRAKWVDYSGPDPSGKMVGIALFDHPANLRYPTHWHARTYGLLTANRFGTNHFDPKFAKPKGVPCLPHGTGCPACESGEGSYTVQPGDPLQLKHRFFLHRGDAAAAKVSDQFSNYTSGKQKKKPDTPRQ